MYIIDDILVSEEIASVRFACDLKTCKGICCVEGDAGAPLEEEEIGEIEDLVDIIKPFLMPEAIKTIEETGVFSYDEDGDYVTSLVNDRECVFVYYENGVALCAIEKAFRQGLVDFPKPISCHLYPVRVTKKENFTALNYHQWAICSTACELGKRNNVPLYQSLREPLIRAYGEKWYKKLVYEIEEKED
jgi:hypothetical protein